MAVVGACDYKSAGSAVCMADLVSGEYIMGVDPTLRRPDYFAGEAKLKADC